MLSVATKPAMFLFFFLFPILISAQSSVSSIKSSSRLTSSSRVSSRSSSTISSINNSSNSTVVSSTKLSSKMSATSSIHSSSTPSGSISKSSTKISVSSKSSSLTGPSSKSTGVPTSLSSTKSSISGNGPSTTVKSSVSSSIVSSSKTSNPVTSKVSSQSSTKSGTGGVTTSKSGSNGVTTSIPSATDTVTGTITSSPSGFSAFTLSGTTSYTTNDWITTTGADHSTTLIPLIIAGGGRGVVFWNLPPIPHVEFSFPGLPKLHLPCIKVFGVSVGDCSSPPASDGPPPDDPTTTTNPTTTDKTTTDKTTSTSKSSSSSCTVTKTASDCLVSCISAASSTSCATACSQTQTGCSVQGTTSTISSVEACTTGGSASGGCNGGCIPGPTAGTNIPSATAQPDPVTTDLDLRRHNIAGRIPIEKRGATSDITSLGNCVLATSITRPAWPGVTKDIMVPDNANNLPASFKAISRYDRATNVGCVFTTTRVDVAAFTNAPPFADYTGKVYKNNNDGSLDHAYEKAWLKQFFDTTFSNVIGGNKITCNQINTYFNPSGCSTPLLQPVFDGLASTINLDFIIMSQYINGWKTIFFPDAGKSFPQLYLDPDWKIPSSNADSGWKWPSGDTATQYSAKDALVTMLTYFEKVLYGTLEMNADNMQDLIDKTNNQIYGQLLNAHDEIQKQSNLAAYQAAFPGTDGIASAYKDFMTNTILPQINDPPKYLTNLWSNVISPDITNAKNLKDVATDPNNPSNPGQYLSQWQTINNLISAHETHYKSGTGYSWEYTFSFTWNAIRKRDLRLEARQSGGSCPISSGSGSSKSSVATSKPTSVPSSKPSSGTSVPVSSKPSSQPSASTSVPPTTVKSSSSGSTSPKPTASTSPTKSTVITSGTSKAPSTSQSPSPTTSQKSSSASSSSSSSSPLPTECPSGCTCVEADSGGCFCECT